MQSNARISEIQGIAAQHWGSVYIPVHSGKVTLQVKGDLLESNIYLGFGKQTIWTRIQSINSVEINQTPAYALLGLGIFIILSGIGALIENMILGLIIIALGAAIAAYAWMNKRRLLVIYALNSTIPVFMNKPNESYEKFAMGILAFARQLNSQPNGQRPQAKQPVTR